MYCIDWCKVYRGLAISFEEKIEFFSSKTNNIHVKDFSVKDLFDKCE